MRKAFTLAEVLITLGIIGVVAAITMPTLIHNHQKRSLEVATQKFYSMMSQAVRQYMADEGVDDLRNTPLNRYNYGDENSAEAVASIQNFINKYLKVVQECKENCFASEYRNWSGNKLELNISQVGKPLFYKNYVLSDGIVMHFGYGWGDPIDLYVDINGKKGPNRVGYDLWSMSIFYDGTIDESSAGPEAKRGEDGWDTPHDARVQRFELCKNDTYGGCFGHFLENNFKFDY